MEIKVMCGCCGEEVPDVVKVEVVKADQDQYVLDVVLVGLNVPPILIEMNRVARSASKETVH